MTYHAVHNGNGHAAAASAIVRNGDPGSLPPADAGDSLPSDAAIGQAIDAARELAGILSQSQVTRIAISIGDVRWEVERRESAPAPSAPPVQPAAVAPVAALPPPSGPSSPPAADAPRPAEASRAVAVTAPLVGAFYSAPAPGQPPFAEPGTRVIAGQQVAIVEAMKLMNEIVAPCAGVVAEVLVANADIVEYGQTLMTIEPD
jgi:acetyl-CoA carboxylase biotin carboxyl carrier protein